MGGCCILYKLQLQTTIALSMSESEYGALKSSMMRVVIPLREVMLEMMNYVGMKDCNSKEIFFPKDTLSNLKTTVHEDNSAALALE